MRLIDADAIIKKVVDLYAEVDEETEGDIVVNRVIDLIDNTPTAEPEKVLVASVTFDEDKLKDIIQTEVIEKIKSGDLVICPEERKQGEWVSVSERLPEKNGFYITTCQDICERRVHTVCYDVKNKEWGRGGVIAWQPLPEPCKEEGAE